MAVAHVATGARTTGNAGTTTTAVARPTTGNTAGNLTICGRCIKPDTASATTEAGWTRASNGTGGTGTTGVDVGPTRTAIDYQELVGGESGSVTFDQGSTPNAVASCMITYSKTGAFWSIDQGVGPDNTHGTGRSSTSGAMDVMAGDVIVAFVGSDTDDATAYTSPAFTATGMTFTTTMRLGAGGVSQNNDCGIAIYEGVVTAGAQASVAVTLTLAGGPSNCGTTAFIRLREVTPAITQASYRVYADGTETGSTALANQDTSYSANLASGDANMQLRVRLQLTNATPPLATDDFQLQYEVNASGTWVNVTASSSVVQGFLSANLTEGAATTNRLGAGTGSFVAGKVSEDGLVDNHTWTANNYTELLYSITVRQADVSNSDTIRFRVLRNASTLTYTQTPTVTITGIVSYPALSTLTDTFDSVLDTATWAAWGTPAPVWEAGQVKATSGDGTYAGITSQDTFDFRNSSFSVKVTAAALTPTLGSRETTVVVLNTAGDGAIMAVVGTASAPSLLMRRKQGGVDTDNSVTYDAVNMAYWRMRLVGTTLYWDTSPNGVAWNNQASQTTTTNLSAVTVDMSVGQWDTNEVDVASGYFDTVNSIPPGLFIGEIATAESLTPFAAGANFQTPVGYNLAADTDVLIIVTGLTDGAAQLSAPTLVSSVATGTNPTLTGYAPLTLPSTGWYCPLAAWGTWNPFIGVFTTTTATAITDWRLTFDSTDAIYGVHINFIELYGFGGLSTQYGVYNSTTFSSVTVALDDGTGTILADSINLIIGSLDGDPRAVGYNPGNEQAHFQSQFGNCAFIHSDPTPTTSIGWGAVSAGPAGAFAVALSLLAEVTAPPAGGLPKVWNGSAWVAKPAKVWNGSAWVQKPVKVWSGSAWETV